MRLLKILRWGLLSLTWLWGSSGYTQTRLPSERRWQVGDTAVGISLHESTVVKVYDHRGQQVVVAQDEHGRRIWWYASPSGQRSPWGIQPRPNTAAEDATYGPQQDPAEWFWRGLKKRPKTAR